jgi:hypothetical protein
VKYRVFIRPRAEADLQDAMRWYEERKPGLGNEFGIAVGAATRSLETNAEQRPIYYRGLRRVLIREFPYKVFYRAEGDALSSSPSFTQNRITPDGYGNDSTASRQRRFHRS